MPRAVAEANVALLATLRKKFAHVVAIRSAPELICERPGAPIYLVTLDSPLISEDTPHVEIVVDRDGIRFKPWRDV